MVEPFQLEHVNPASLDVTLGPTILIESAENRQFVSYSIAECTPDQPYWLVPGQFILASTIERFNLPDDVAAQFMLKSSRAREGLEHLLAGYCDPGWYDSVLTLELHNSRQLHQVPIWHGMRIGQMVFYQLSEPVGCSYAITGRYNGDDTVVCSKD